MQLSQPVKISTAKEFEETSTIRITVGKKKVKKALFFLLALLDFGCSSSLSDSNQALFHHQLISSRIKERVLNDSVYGKLGETLLKVLE